MQARASCYNMKQKQDFASKGVQGCPMLSKEKCQAHVSEVHESH